MNRQHVQLASGHLNDASRDMHAAWAMTNGEIPEDNEFFKDAIERMQCAAKALGLELVRRVSAAEAHERMVAARAAEGSQEAELYQGAPIDAGPDDGLQHDERGHLVGSR
jgi:hypothetical protein